MSNSKKSLGVVPALHGKILRDKIKATKAPELMEALSAYEEFIREIEKISILDEVGVNTAVDLVNQYRAATLHLFEGRENSGQENLRSTILEEFFYHLFRGLINQFFASPPENLIIGKANGYVDLAFTPKSFNTVFFDPHPYFHIKAQDFVVGASVIITVEGGNKTKSQANLVIPVLAIECKTYIESNMLDSCAGSARRLKSAMPYCLYIVASEYMKIDDASPELTDIDEVYILCKASNSDRVARAKGGHPPHPIDQKLVWDLFTFVEKHLRRQWWSPAESLGRGKIINRL